MSRYDYEKRTDPFTLLGGYRQQGVNPFDYLNDLFTRLPAAKITEIRLFAPTAWIKATAKPNPVARAA